MAVMNGFRAEFLSRILGVNGHIAVSSISKSIEDYDALAKRIGDLDGVELATPGYLEPTRILDVKLECLSSYGHRLKSTTLIRLELAAREVRARLILLDGSALEPGTSAYAQLRSGEWLTAAYGQPGFGGS